MKWASSAMQGWRVNMEDADIAVTKVGKFDKLSFFGVLDGHGGDLTSKYCGEHLLETITEQEAFQKVTAALESGLIAEAFTAAIRTKVKVITSCFTGWTRPMITILTQPLHQIRVAKGTKKMSHLLVVIHKKLKNSARERVRDT